MLVNETFVHLLEVTCLERPGLDVQYGGVGGFIAKKPPKRVDPMKIIQVNDKKFNPYRICSVQLKLYLYSAIPKITHNNKTIKHVYTVYGKT